MRTLLFFAMIVLFPFGLLAQENYTEILNHDLDPHFQGSMINYGNYVLCSGFTSFTTSGATASTDLYLNDGSGVFTYIPKPFIDVHNGFALAYDGANGTNFVVVGGTTFTATPFDPEGKIYIDNGSGGYTIQTIVGLFRAVGIFADFDNDGDYDLWTEGIDVNGNPRRVIYRNDNDIFVEVINTTIDVRYGGSISVGDSDNDGDLDVLRSGGNIIAYTDFFRNDGAFNFTTISNDLPDVVASAHIFVDVNGDGDLDVIISGSAVSGNIFEIYLGDGNNDFSFSSSFTGIYNSAIEFDDVDNDGDQDFYILGEMLGGAKGTYLYINDGSGNFTQDESFDPGVDEGMIVVFDVNSDGFKDFIFMGDVMSPPFSDPQARVYLNVVLDTEDPIAVCQNITVQLDTNGNVSITGTDVDGGSTDNVGIISYTVNPNTFNCNDTGSNTVTLTVEDAAGNTDTCTATVTVVDDMNPTTIGKDIIIDLNGNPSVTITPDVLDDGSFDNCDFTLSLSMDTFTEIGVFDVDLTSTDDSSNSDTETYQVTVVNTLGVDDNLFADVVLWPNPTRGDLHISLGSHQGEMIIVYDQLGRKVFQTDNVELLDFSPLNSGLFYVKIKTDKGVETFKIIKQ